MDEQYIEQLAILIILSFILCLSKLFRCCYSLGLYQKNKEVKLRGTHSAGQRLIVFKRKELVKINLYLQILFVPVEILNLQSSPKLSLVPLFQISLKETEKAPTHAD